MTTNHPAAGHGPAGMRRLACALVCITSALVMEPPAQVLLKRPAKEHVPETTPALFQPVLADLDGDGDIDMVDQGEVTLNQGGRFVTGVERIGFVLAVADLDGDGQPDLVDTGTRTPSDPLGIALNRQPFGYLRQTIWTMNPNGVALADFDSDGDIDVAATVSSPGRPTAQFANDGTGRFVDVTTTRMPVQQFDAVERGLRACDLDNDGDPDLLVTSGTAGLQALINRGGGVFAPPTGAIFGGNRSRVLGIADVDADGDLDLFVDQGTLLLNQGGRFAPAAVQPLPPDSSPIAVASADLDRDGDLDLWYEVASPSSSRWFENVGQAFVDRVATTPSVRRRSKAVALTDYDRDGLIDVVAGSNRLELLRGQPAGRFVEVTPLDDAASAYGDFNGDRIVDQLMILGVNLYLRAGDGVGGFVERPVSPAAPVTAVLGVADLDRDGDLDLLIEQSIFAFAANFAFNDGAGNFTVVSGSFPATLKSVGARWLGDFDGDGDTDVIASAQDFFQVRAYHLLRNDGAGVMTRDPNWALSGVANSLQLSSVADADRDGDLDFVTGGTDPVLLRNDGTGSFTADPTAIPGRHATTGIAPNEIVQSDLDGDGDLDLVIGYYPFAPNPSTHAERAAVFLNDGSGRYAVGAVLNSGDPWIRVHAADIDGDGDPDVIASIDRNTRTGATNRIEVLRNDGRGALSLSPIRVEGSNKLQFGGFTDIDGDDDLDFVEGAGFSPLTNRTTDLRARFVPQIGGLLQLAVGSGATISMVLVSAAPLPTPVRLGSWGLLTIDPAVGVAFQLSSGGLPVESHLVLPVPRDPGLVGLKIYAQAVARIGAANARLTTAICETIAF